MGPLIRNQVIQLQKKAAALSVLALMSGFAHASEPAAKSFVAIGEGVDVFNIGQDGYCGARSEIESPGKKRFAIPGGKKTYFFIKTSFHTPLGKYVCEGDFSFVSEPGRLHIVRYTWEEHQCILQFFQAIPGEDPHPAPVDIEPRQICIGR